MAILLGVGLATPAFATVVTNDIPYKTSTSSPNNTCVYPGDDIACGYHDKNSGLAETWVINNDFGEHWAKAYHEMNPANPGTPTTGFKITSGGNEGVFRNYVTALLFINQDGVGTAEARYGGNVFKYNSASQEWVHTYYFFAKKNTDGTHDFNVFVDYVKVISAGDWTMGSLHESYVFNQFGSDQNVDVNSGTGSGDREWYSNQLYMRYPL